MTNPIYKNENYEVVVGDASLDLDYMDAKATVYKVVNLNTGVVEIETSVLPKAMGQADQVNAILTNYDAKVIGNIARAINGLMDDEQDVYSEQARQGLAN